MNQIEQNIYYTWRDIEVELLKNKSIWPETWNNIEVYSSEVIIYVYESNRDVESESKEFLSQIFKSYFSKEENEIKIKSTHVTLGIFYEVVDKEHGKKHVAPSPLFKEYLYLNEQNNMEQEVKKLPGAKVVAFHSYKGGVGRTLSLFSVAKEIIEKFQGKKKVLIVDSDIEAPGLTWLSREENPNFQISYMDILSIINSTGYNEEIIGNVSRIIEKSCISFVTRQMEGTHYFLPTYRCDAQIMDVYDNPERVLMGETNKYIIVDYLSQIGKELDVDLVLVDLRAGISEYAAPFLFDPRVSKVLVSSTSYQSAYGTRMVLDQIEKQMSTSADTKIILNMVPEPFDKDARDKVYNVLLKMDSDAKSTEEDVSLSDFITEIPANSSLIHLGDLNQICRQLNIADDFSIEMRKIVSTLLPKDDIEKDEMKDKEQYIVSLHKLASDELTAEGNGISEMLTTKALKAIGTSFKWEIPQIVVLGMKGSGKTYLYKQLLHAKKWNIFIEHLGEQSKLDKDVLIYPFIYTQKKKELNDLIKECTKTCGKEIPFISENIKVQTKIVDVLKEKREEEITESQWDEIWKQLIFEIFQQYFDELEKIDEYLENLNKKVVLIVDGLEDIFFSYDKSTTERAAIRSLCVNLINRLSELEYGNIGIVTFLRKDIAQLSITPNFEQFLNQYYQYELKWSQTDALRLALWLSKRAKSEDGDIFIKTKDGVDVPIENASRTIVEEALHELWGRKMGPDNSKTAVTARWVLASLSDFNGQLQARDIVRFLKYSTVGYQKEEGKNYADRYLMPNRMKHAIQECSKEKYNDVETEIVQLKPIFSKLKSVKNEDKTVPLKEDVLLQLTIEEKKTLMNYGYLKEVDNEYYIPEIIRYALDFNKAKRGGSKIVSLLVQK